MTEIEGDKLILIGPKGKIPIECDDEILSKLSMLFEGEQEYRTGYFGLWPTKKLHLFHPDKNLPKEIETYRTSRAISIERCDPQSIERGVRELLADKVSGNMVGLW